MAISKALLLKCLLGSACACLAGIGVQRNTNIFNPSGDQSPSAGVQSSTQHGNNGQTVDPSPQQQSSVGDGRVTETGSENVAGDPNTVNGETTPRAEQRSEPSTTLPGAPDGDAASRVSGGTDTGEQVQKPGSETPDGVSLPAPGPGTPSLQDSEKPQVVDSPEPTKSKQPELVDGADRVQDSNDLADGGVQSGQGHGSATLTEKPTSQAQVQGNPAPTTTTITPSTDTENPTNPTPSNPAVDTGSQEQDRSGSHQSAQDSDPNLVSNPQETPQTVTTGSGADPVVTNTVDTDSSSSLKEPNESQTDTQDPGTPSSQDLGITSQPQPQQAQQKAQEATEDAGRTSTEGGVGTGGASLDNTTDDSKTNLGEGTTEGNDLQTKDVVTSDSEGKQVDKASKVEGADAGSEGLQGSNGDNNGRTENQVPQATEQQETQTQNDVNGGAGGANTADGSLGNSADVTGGQKDGGSADPAPSTKQQPEQGADSEQSLQSGESAGDTQKTPSGEPNPPSTTGGSEPREGAQGEQVQDGTVNQPSQPQTQDSPSTGQEGATVTVPPAADGASGATPKDSNGESSKDLNSNSEEKKTLSQDGDQTSQSISRDDQPLSNQSDDTQHQVTGDGQAGSTPVSKENGDSPALSTDDNQANPKANESGEGDNNKAASKELDENTPTGEVKEGETVTTVTEPVANPAVVSSAEPVTETQTDLKTQSPSELPGSSDSQTVDNIQDSHQIQSPDISTSDTTDTPDESKDVGQVPGDSDASLPKVEGKGDEQEGAGLTDQASEIANTGNTDGNNNGGGSDPAQVPGAPAAPSTPTVEGGEKGVDNGGADDAAVNSKEVKDTQEGQQGTPQDDHTKTQGSEGTVHTTESTTSPNTTSEGVEAPAVGTEISSEKAATTTIENSDSDSSDLSDQASRTSEPQLQQDEPSNPSGQPNSVDTGLNAPGQSGDVVDQVDTTSGATQGNTAEQISETPTVTEVTEKQKSKPEVADGVQEQAPAAPVAGEKDSSHQAENVPAADISDKTATENSALPSAGATPVTDSVPKGEAAPTGDLATGSDSTTGDVKITSPDGTTGQGAVTDVSSGSQDSGSQSLGGSSSPGVVDSNVTDDNRGNGSQDLNNSLQGDDPNALTSEEGKVDTKSPQDNQAQEDVVKKEEQGEKEGQVSLPPAIEPTAETEKQVSKGDGAAVTETTEITPPSTTVEQPQPPQQPLAQNQEETSQPVVNTPAPESSSTSTTTDEVPQTEDKVEEIDLSKSKDIIESQNLAETLTNPSGESPAQTHAPSGPVTVTNSRKKRSLNSDFKKKLEDIKKVKAKLKEMNIGNASCKIFRKKPDEDDEEGKKDYVIVCQISFAEITGSSEFMDKWKESGKKEDDEEDFTNLVNGWKIEGLDLT